MKGREKQEKNTGRIWRQLAAMIMAVMCLSLIFVQGIPAEEAVPEDSLIADGVMELFEEDTVISETVTEELVQETDNDPEAEPAETDDNAEAGPAEPEIMEPENTEPEITEPEQTADIPFDEEISEAILPIPDAEADPEAEMMPESEITEVISIVIEDFETEVQEIPAEPVEPETEFVPVPEISEVLGDVETEELEAQEERDLLTVGMTGEDVYKMQVALKELNYLGAEPDGVFGNQSLMAVKRFQLYNGLTITGEADKDTLARLNSGNALSYRTLAKGASGYDVYYIQIYLYNAGFLLAAPDGGYGGYTEAAVKAYQAQAGLESPDGMVGNWTSGQMVESNIVFRNLGLGTQGYDVYGLQNMLQEQGFLDATPDGAFGRMSEKAVRLLQMYVGLDITGVADVSTVTAAYLNAASYQELSRGSSGMAVRSLQSILQELGYLNAEPDGGFGSYTEQAVRDFQKANALTADGVFGKTMAEKLFGEPVTNAEYLANHTVDYGGTYMIRTSVGNTVLYVENSSVYGGANVIMNTMDSLGAEKWVMQNAGDGYYYIRNLRSWKVLDLVNGSVRQYKVDGTETQLWKIEKSEDGGFYVINANGLYLENAGTDGVSASEPDGTGSQVWYFEEADPGTALDFRQDGTQYLGIRTFNINQGNVTETSGYYNIQTEIDIPSGGYILSGGDNYSIGLKVMYVNSYLANAGYLSWDYYNYNRYDGNTVWAVRQFQADYGLEVDGVVGIETWRAMGYSEYDWYNLGSYTTGLKVYAYGSDRSTYVDAMLATAREYAAAGTGYADGASGVPGTYVDCSGLIYQCLYAAGINPDTNIIDHARVVYEYTSNYLGNDWQMGMAVSNAQPGDLIFYGGSSINHVAIYAGNGMIYDSWPGIGVSYRSMYSGGNILKIVRVF